MYSRAVLHSSHGPYWFPHGAGGARSDDQRAGEAAAGLGMEMRTYRHPFSLFPQDEL